MALILAGRECETDTSNEESRMCFGNKSLRWDDWCQQVNTVYRECNEGGTVMPEVQTEGDCDVCATQRGKNSMFQKHTTKVKESC